MTTVRQVIRAMTMIGRGGAVPEDGRPETALAAADEAGLRDDVTVQHNVRDLLGDNKIAGTNWTLEFAPDDTEYVGDEPEKKEPGPFLDVTAASHQTDWLVEVSVTCPDGRRVTSDAWFPKPTMSPRAVGEYLIAAAENVRNRVNTLP